MNTTRPRIHLPVIRILDAYDLDTKIKRKNTGKRRQTRTFIRTATCRFCGYEISASGTSERATMQERNIKMTDHINCCKRLNGRIGTFKSYGALCTVQVA